MEHSRALKPGTMVAGDWRIERMLGEGGFGVTYEARHARTGAHVALKEYMPDGSCTRPAGSTLVVPDFGIGAQPFNWGLDKFMDEARTLARLDHPSIVRVTGAFSANGTAYMTLAYEAGGSLKSWLDGLRQGPAGRAPTEAEIDHLVWTLTEALMQVHSLFVLHRDIKPDNIMLRPPAGEQPIGRQAPRMGTPVLIDFGGAKQSFAGYRESVALAQGAKASRFTPVSHGYSPPEQYDRDQTVFVPASDIYALAATLYYAIAGREPPAAPSRYVADRYEPLAHLAAGGGYRPELLAGIDQALAMHPKDRPQSALEFRRAIALTAPPIFPPAHDVETRPAGAAGDVGPSSQGAAARLVTFSELRGAAAQKPAPRFRFGMVAALATAVLGGGAWLAMRPPAVPPDGPPKPEIPGRNDAATEALRLEYEKLTAAKVEADQRVARLEAEAKTRREAEEKARADAKRSEEAKARADETERRRAEDLLKAARAAEAEQREQAAAEARRQEEARRKAEADRRNIDPVAALAPGSGQGARDRLADRSDCSFCPEMVVVPRGGFLMGSPDGSGGLQGTKAEEGRDIDEGPVREVAVRQAFGVSRAHVTRGEFAAFMREGGHRIEPGCNTRSDGKWQFKADAGWQSPGFSQDDRHPVVCVNWNDAKAYTLWLSARTGRTYRLLTEAEAEYAIRGVTSAAASHLRFWFSDEDARLCDYANGADQTAKATIPGASGWPVASCTDGFAYTAPVGSKRRNAFGLVDAVGNAWGWTEDCWIDSYRGAPADERPRITGCTNQGARVVRGGSWSFHPKSLRSSARDSAESRDGNIGFRVARTLSSP